jgi:formylglycine-generating enzyme required for sulfatase activity
MTLHIDSTLQGGKYRILSVLGQGGFGITYLAEQTLLDSKVAIKEFFMKELCERDESTSHVTLGTSSNREMVERCRQKFLKEARTIFKLDHPNIVRIYDVFEENGTAYYVMDYIEGESLANMVKRRGALPEAEALNYIKEVGKALMYIHEKKINHLDIKPSNIMRREEDGRIMLIDFGVSKQYDLVTSEGTSTTPVGISRGYSPAEQYRQHGVQTFSPQSDVYALAATLYNLFTGVTPPEAMEVLDDGLPLADLQVRSVSISIITALQKAMKGRFERTQTITEFLSNLGDTIGKKSDDTEVIGVVSSGTDPNSNPKSNPRLFLKIVMAIVASLLIVFLAFLFGGEIRNDSFVASKETFTVNGVSFTMVHIEGGTFTMGATSEQGVDAFDLEKPAHSVTLSSYSIGETEVTQELWEAVIGSNPSCFKGAKNPVDSVSWKDCQNFIQKLNEKTGRSFRLPTEAEWEYAARGGNRSHGYKYSGSNSIDDVGWYWENSGDTRLSGDLDNKKIIANHCKTHPVAQKKPNELGLYDMSGNVLEWCQDWFGYYIKSDQVNPLGAESGTHRICRGGYCFYDAVHCRLSSRDYVAPDHLYNSLGFRLALTE